MVKAFFVPATLLMAAPALAQTTPAAPPAGVADQAPIAVAEATPPCPALDAFEAERPQVEKVRGLLDKGLATKVNLAQAYDRMGKALEKAAEGLDYDAACYVRTLDATRALAEGTPAGVSAGSLSYPLVTVWAGKCAKAAEFEPLMTCLDDIAAAAADGALDDSRLITMLDALPADKVPMDTEQAEAFLTAVKDQVEAGVFPENQQTRFVNAVLGQ